MKNKMSLPSDFLVPLSKNPHWYTNLEEIKKHLENYVKEIKLLNQLITTSNTSNFKKLFFQIFKKNPKIFHLITLLFAVRHLDKKIKYLWNISNEKKISDEQIEQIYNFLQKMGIFNLIKDKKIIDIYTYLIGIEVGLDSNSRKNRTGNVMIEKVNYVLDYKLKENLIDYFVKKKKIDYVFDNMKKKFKLNDFVFLKSFENLTNDEAKKLKNTTFKFICFKANKIYLIQCNYYNVKGSKINTLLSEYQLINNAIIKLSDKLSQGDYELIFLWISDGNFWKTKKNSEKWKQIKKEGIYLISLQEFIKLFK